MDGVIGINLQMDGNSQLGSEIQLTERVGEEEADFGFKDLQPSAAVSNVYVGKRNFIHQLMDVALLMANVSQLKALLSLPSEDKYYYILLIFIIMSISLQVIFTICMLVIWSMEKQIEEHLEDKKKIFPEDEKRKNIADFLDKVGNVVVLMIIVSNVFITGFGVESHDSGSSPAPTPAPTLAPTPGERHINGTFA